MLGSVSSLRGLTDLNGWDCNRFAGLAANDDVAWPWSRKSLSGGMAKGRYEDRATAGSTLVRILTEGHRYFCRGHGILEEAGIGTFAPQEGSAFLLNQFE